MKIDRRVIYLHASESISEGQAIKGKLSRLGFQRVQNVYNVASGRLFTRSLTHYLYFCEKGIDSTPPVFSGKALVPKSQGTRQQSTTEFLASQMEVVAKVTSWLVLAQGSRRVVAACLGRQS
jgi:hypothetical protein